VPAGFTSSNTRELVEAERDVQARLVEEGVGVQVDVASLAAVSNVFRVATTVRNHMERTVLARADLSFTAFTVLWVLWVWGEQEARHVAEESGISRGTLTGVATTLEARGLVRRRQRPDDRRSVLLAATADGEALVRSLYPAFNAEEAKVTAALSTEQKEALADALRVVLRTVEGLSSG
jgi:DNA-binding MarR family transcriptional regulator